MEPFTEKLQFLQTEGYKYDMSAFGQDNVLVSQIRPYTVRKICRNFAILPESINPEYIGKLCDKDLSLVAENSTFAVLLGCDDDEVRNATQQVRHVKLHKPNDTFEFPRYRILMILMILIAIIVLAIHKIYLINVQKKGFNERQHMYFEGNRVCPRRLDYDNFHVRSCEEEIKALATIHPYFCTVLSACKPFSKTKLHQTMLTQDQILAIAAYTHNLGTKKEMNMYYIMNKVLLLRDENHESVKLWKGFVRHLKMALESLPRKTLITYRGIPTQGELLRNVIIGQSLYWPTFTSTSTNREAALGFAGTNGVFMIFKIESGKKISEYSCYPNEAEVLLPPDICFIVEDVNYRGRIKEIVLKEQIK